MYEAINRDDIFKLRCYALRLLPSILALNARSIQQHFDVSMSAGSSLELAGPQTHRLVLQNDHQSIAFHFGPCMAQPSKLSKNSKVTRSVPHLCPSFVFL